VLHRRGVMPRIGTGLRARLFFWCSRFVLHAGTALLFPHGDTQGVLLHEGSGVTEGAKYVVRTDVLYMR
jgi:hypothetical protein